MKFTFMNIFAFANRKTHYSLFGILLLLIVFSSADLALDGFPALSLPHLSIHISLILLYVAAILVLLQIKPDSPNQSENKTTEQTPPFVSIETDPILSLSDKMDQAFDRWQLTPAERKIATLLILGHSLKEIAESCHRGEGTVRQHATTVYKKAQLSGRAKLTAFFLQDFIDTEQLHPPSEIQNATEKRV
ncbi:MAG: hypothetical protein CO158_08395 [Piscirickettsiaceae bacterium CG_4_9_14_3_um_filter_43_564]|nr:helix-turn-helix transcriptional regulator [Thiomicrospira sp.]OIP93573.1 MAG: hypothetical protein AUK56_11555 [Thiomicrospira sp. CG2_30_44_34]PIQ05174.1 MAG: hypothetical protein COW74_03035 [Piscirickettsiaceae bacterium CG18_big_fil_WC_8_21_14_2_50_44_103]PIU38825.1 MAG: hypothetical protein COT01_04815 [Piscirickettsiaceae bacterium CG07_land_8_20_14_0_80_44_28]PIW78454.1 MAG: hypothetical protein CO000_01385 [Piscirickettsiaceae bacterium CG_4_8_14_3_um_filter_44_38]PJA65497.1 MAG: h